MENSELFHREIMRKGLSLGTYPRTGTSFFLDLNSGSIYVEANPLKVMRIVRIARKYAEGDEYGDHNAILDLVADKAKLAKGGKIYWERPYFVHNKRGYISMRD